MQIHTEHKTHESGGAAMVAYAHRQYRDLKARKDTLDLKVQVISATNSSITGYHGIHHGDCRICC